MKAYLWLPLACLVGFLVGSWGARDELRAFKEHAREEKEKTAAKPEGFDAFARMVKIPEMARRPRRPRHNKATIPISPISATNAASAKVSAATEKDPPLTAEGKESAESSANASSARLSAADLRARIEEAQDLWRTRVDVARMQWKSKLKLAGEAEKAFDTALQEMNERLYDSVAALAGILAEKDEMTPELGLRLVGETTTILAETYDKIGDCTAPTLREAVSTMQMTDFIDPGVAEPLITVQGKLDGFVHGRRSR